MPDVDIDIPFEAYIGEKPYLFVAYAHADAALVYPVLDALHKRGYRVWYDEGIDPGNEWPEDIAYRLSKCASFITFISPRAVESRNVRNEINFALSLNVPFLAIHLESTSLPAGLQLQISSMQAIMMYRMTSDGFTRKILRFLDASLIAGGGEHAQPPSPIVVPPQAGPITKANLSRLFAAARQSDPARLSGLRNSIASEISPVAEKAMKRFCEWLSIYNHHDGYENIGKALHIWLNADRGVVQLVRKFDLFLQLVSWLTVSQQLQEGLQCKLGSGEIQTLTMPADDAWLRYIDASVFDAAIAEEEERDSRRRT